MSVLRHFFNTRPKAERSGSVWSAERAARPGVGVGRGSPIRWFAGAPPYGEPAKQFCKAKLSEAGRRAGGGDAVQGTQPQLLGLLLEVRAAIAAMGDQLGRKIDRLDERVARSPCLAACAHSLADSGRPRPISVWAATRARSARQSMSPRARHAATRTQRPRAVCGS
jgi:hypothetical protein